MSSAGKALTAELPEAERVAMFRAGRSSIVKIDGLKRRVVDKYANGASIEHSAACDGGAWSAPGLGLDALVHCLTVGEDLLTPQSGFTKAR